MTLTEAMQFLAIIALFAALGAYAGATF